MVSSQPTPNNSLKRTKQPVTWLAYATQAPERLGHLTLR
jgi:hypothetical protein